MHTSSFGTEQVLLRIIAVLAGIGVLFNTVGDFARADANPLCASPELYDLDGSGMVTPADILALIDGMNGLDPQSPKFDMDGSGIVDEQDIDALAAHVQGCRSGQPAHVNGNDTEMQNQVGEPQVVATLTPSAPSPYAPGQQIEITVSLQRAQPGIPLPARLIQFDSILSYVTLGITYPITHPAAAVGPIEFWDFSSTPICAANPAMCGDTYFRDPSVFFPPDPIVVIAFIGMSPDNLRQITVPADGTAIPVGLIRLTAPLIPGIYRLDVMNAANLDLNFGADFRGGFGTAQDPTYYQYHASTGQFAGGIIDLAVGVEECVSGNPCMDDDLDCTEDICINELCQHPPKSAGTPCGDSTVQGDCDQPDQCNGNGVCSQNFVGADVVCRAAQGECDQAENCTGLSAVCPPDLFVLSGMPCTDDGIGCTSDTCLSGECIHLPFPTGTSCVDDGIECTSDTCSNGECVHPPRAAGTPCGQLQPQGDCDMPDICNGTGVCSPNLTPGGTVCRAAASGCDQSEYCNGLSPACPADLYASNGTPCTEDGDECTNDVCDGAGQCAHGEIVGCRAIPAVSTWGFVILSLVLMVGAKLRFRIRSPQN